MSVERTTHRKIASRTMKTMVQGERLKGIERTINANLKRGGNNKKNSELAKTGALSRRTKKAGEKVSWQGRPRRDLAIYRRHRKGELR